ncbi:MAG: hydroxyacylglutathione hydrolase [Cyanobacteria bacterium]|nr:hydroxyacylglutathione hydrolase [Cyanobacteriota bacterium]MDA1246251.1 hydroxyacylglutathione hydrolase [Cyanobacteriota bacterium]
MQQLSVGLIPVLSDNYIFLLQRQGQAVVVDPAVAEPVIAALEQQGLELMAILHTHHHSDHIGGTPGLLARWPKAAVLASSEDRLRIPLQTKGVGDGDSFELLGEPIHVISVPGHTRAHIAYHLPVAGHLFCGDTLFVGGCGRLFEGSAAEMHASLQRLAQLPATTKVWCAHEYTQANLSWAAAVVPASDPCAGAIEARLAAVGQARARGEATIPSSVEQELETNLFLRASSPEQFAELRSSKDHWPG